MAQDLFAQFYEESHRITREIQIHKVRDRDLMALEYLSGCGSVFELGCGTGRILSMCDATQRAGVDVSTSAVEQAREQGEADRPLNVRVHNVDRADLPWEAESFESCMAIEVLEHVFDPVHALAELNRILLPGGKLVVAIPNIGYFRCRSHLLRTGELTDFHGNGMIVNEHIRYYGVKSISQLLRLAGFEIIRIRGAQKQVVQILGAGAAAVKAGGSGGWSLDRSWQLMKPTPSNILSKCSRLFALWRRYPGLFAVGLVVEARKVEEPRFHYNAAIDRILGDAAVLEFNVDTIG